MDVYALLQSNRFDIPILNCKDSQREGSLRYEWSPSKQVSEFFMNQIDLKSEEWQVCKPGELVHFAASENAKVTRRRLMRIGGVTTLVVLTGILLSFREPNSTEPNYGGIRCSVVRSKAKAHLAGKLDAVTETKIAEHLKQCSLCASFMTRTANDQASIEDMPIIHYVTTVAK